jgi:hypothetical protein
MSNRNELILKESNMSSWAIKDLRTLYYSLGVLSFALGAFYFLYTQYSESIETTKQEIVRSWTNEGDVDSDDTIFITLEPENVDRDIIGSISNNINNRVFSINAKVGWPTTTLELTEIQGLIGKVVHIATVRVKLTGDNNRLEWTLLGNTDIDFLPKKTTLWPSMFPPQDFPLHPIKFLIPRIDPSIELACKHKKDVRISVNRLKPSWELQADLEITQLEILRITKQLANNVTKNKLIAESTESLRKITYDLKELVAMGFLTIKEDSFLGKAVYETTKKGCIYILSNDKKE